MADEARAAAVMDLSEVKLADLERQGFFFPRSKTMGNMVLLFVINGLWQYRLQMMRSKS